MATTRKAKEQTGRLWIEPGEQKVGLIAQVAPETPVFKTYSFAVPSGMAGADGRLELGQRVMIPVGRRGRLTRGFVVGLEVGPWHSTLRPIHSLVDSESFLAADLVELAREIAGHYHCPLGRTLKAITPESVRKGRGLRRVIYVRSVAASGYSDKASPQTAPSRSARRFARHAERSEASPVPPQPKNLEILRCAQNDGTGPVRLLSAKRRAVLSTIAQSGNPMRLDHLLDQAKATRGLVRKMAADGLLVLEERREEAAEPDLGALVSEPDFTLNLDQRAALNAIEAAIAADTFRVLLLYGVSGSGKTEVYIHAIRRVIAAGRQAILLVPEIVLTTQLVSRLAARLPRVAVMHSGLADAERSIMWRRIAAGERDVVVGTRSAVFAPCPRLGLIVVDEEQEPSFKNLQAPRFHVRDVAIMRARQLGVPVVLGSATPSLETWHRSETRSDYQRLILPKRIRDLPMPKVHVVDMDAEQAELKRPVVLSRVMEQGLAESLERGEQAILLMNRRGFANRIFCPNCRARLTCPNCNVNLVVHTSGSASICHYCRTRVPIPEVCPQVTCGTRLVQMGLGTQRIEKVLAERFPKARIRRVDSDTMRRRSDYEQVVADFEDRKLDVLVGTQMIAKGLDFPFVSFVGVFEASAAAFSGDFRAHERLFQLVTQVAGRAGRADTPGRVVVQTTETMAPVAFRFPSIHPGEARPRPDPQSPSPLRDPDFPASLGDPQSPSSSRDPQSPSPFSRGRGRGEGLPRFRDRVAGSDFEAEIDRCIAPLRYALSHDYEAFAVHELAMRRQVGWPPFRRLARIVVSHEREQTAAEQAEALVQRIHEAGTRLALVHADVIGPSACVLSRIRGKYRYELLIRTASAKDLRKLLDHLEENGRLRTKAASMMLDVDPVDMA